MSISTFYHSMADFVSATPAVWAWVLLCGVAALVAFRNSMPKTPNVPLVGFDVKDAKKRKAQYSFDAPGIVQKGYEQFKDRIFGVDTADGVKLVFPHQYVEEISKEPGLSFHNSLDHDLLIDYTYMGGLKEFSLTTFKKEIIPHLPKFIPEFTELIQGYIPGALGDNEDWTPVNIYPKMLRMLGILTARVMIDNQAPHNDTWITLTTEYVQSGTSYAHQLKFWPGFMRPLVHRFLPEYSEIQRQLSDGRSILVQAIENFNKRESQGSPEPQPTSVLYHMSRKAAGTSSSVIDMHLKEQMNLAVGGIHTTSAVLTQTLFELSSHPEYVPELRQEVVDTLRKFDGVLSKAALWDMHKLDSFIREAHRLNSPNLTTLQRRATRDVTLSDGTFIPKGTKLEFPTFAIHRDTDFYEDATSFDGYRFLKKRHEDEETSAKHHYVSARKDMLGWGYGKTACPGRFLADIEIKLIVAFILLNYDIKNPEGQGRHKSVHFENQVFPNPSKPVLIRKIQREGAEKMNTGQI
ncbi:Cytochrome P450 monooxygenase ATR2 [Colletotrichum siamense]|nr:Cytochrome P450 monooxygenase ATR2 [Colletotrichum siamense]